MTLNHDTFQEVLESCRRFLLSIANHEVPPDLRAKGGASDLVQQTFAAALRCEQQFRGESLAELRAWLRAILRSEAAVFRRQFYSTASRDVSRESNIDPKSFRDQQTPPSVAIQTEDDLRLSEAFSRLPETQRVAVTLRIEHQKTFAEIGATLNRSEDAARKLFTNALSRLRGRLGDPADESV